MEFLPQNLDIHISVKSQLVQYNAIPPSTIQDLRKTLIYLLLLLAAVEVQMENEKIMMSAIFSAVCIFYQG